VKPALPATEAITGRIAFIRGHKVLLDADLAALYGVPTGRFNEAVRRNLARFPQDFMFQLTDEEQAALRSQFAISNSGRGGRRYLPYAFTEHGASMSWNQDSRGNSPPTTRPSQASSMPSVNSWCRPNRPRSDASGSCRTTEPA
jgi:hypothetical protein